MNKKTKTPLFHVSKRPALPWYKTWAIRGAALLLALVLNGIITSLVTGEDPFAVYAAIWKGSFGTTRKFWVLMQNIAMLLCVSLAVTPAFRMRFWNIGAEGQGECGDFRVDGDHYGIASVPVRLIGDAGAVQFPADKRGRPVQIPAQFRIHMQFPTQRDQFFLRNRVIH